MRCKTRLGAELPVTLREPAIAFRNVLGSRVGDHAHVQSKSLSATDTV
jgi:hypothetical protein